jgi:hypothetical protein
VKLPPLLHERSMNAEMALLVLGPTVLGALAGFLLGTSKGGYLIVSLIAALGGFAAGLEHPGWRPGFYRGLLGGLLYGTALLVVFDLREKAAKAGLPDHKSLIVVIAAVAGVILSSAGGAVRGRHEQRADSAPASR